MAALDTRFALRHAARASPPEGDPRMARPSNCNCENENVMKGAAAQQVLDLIRELQEEGLI